MAFMHEYYSGILRDVKKILRISDICRITGYGKTILNTWFLSGNLRYVVTRGAKHTAKENLIDFLSSDAFDKVFSILSSDGFILFDIRILIILELFIQQFQTISSYITIHCIKYPLTDASVIAKTVEYIR